MFWSREAWWLCQQILYMGCRPHSVMRISFSN
ncbi:unnamed protein product [Toxocara canis]|uniref:Uncharacterized protein n=1 Tax=Toxocara canis TaxID=6265 RepID=A0A183ULH8_TOXCA|nr:unnamed protein product [Toxocara canis]